MPETARRHIVYTESGFVLRVMRTLGFGVKECEVQASDKKENGERFAAAISSINRIERMKPNWGHHREVVPSAATRNAAVDFLRKIARDYGADIPDPTMVAPTDDGFVSVEWRLRTPAEAIELVFRPNGTHEYSVRDLKTRRFEVGSEEASEGELAQVLKIHVAGRNTIDLVQ